MKGSFCQIVQNLEVWPVGWHSSCVAVFGRAGVVFFLALLCGQFPPPESISRWPPQPAVYFIHLTQISTNTRPLKPPFLQESLLWDVLTHICLNWWSVCLPLLYWKMLISKDCACMFITGEWRDDGTHSGERGLNPGVASLGFGLQLESNRVPLNLLKWGTIWSDWYRKKIIGTSVIT